MSRYRRIGTPLLPGELDRARRTARVRGLSVPEFLRQSAIVVSDETLAPIRFQSDPWERRETVTFAEPPERKRTDG